MAMRVAVTLTTTIITTVSAHASMVVPSPRNAVDKDLAPWNQTVPEVRRQSDSLCRSKNQPSLFASCSVCARTSLCPPRQNPLAREM